MIVNTAMDRTVREIEIFASLELREVNLGK